MFIEWGDSVEDAVGEDYLTIHITIDGDARDFTFEPSGSWCERTLDILQ